MNTPKLQPNLRKPKPISPNPNRFNKKLGSFLHFALPQRDVGPKKSHARGFLSSIGVCTNEVSACKRLPQHCYAIFRRLPMAIRLGPAYTVIKRRELRAPPNLLSLPSENLMSDTLDTVFTGRLLRLALNRPDKRNALNLELCRALVEALEAADRNPDVGAILLTGNGKSFCAGMDLHEIAEADTGPISQVHEQLFTLGARLGKPLIAAIHGAALAGGTGLVANCHIVIASADATFGLTEIRLGLWPFLVFRALTAALGERRTVELALTGRVFNAAEARELGLVHEISADPAARALEVAGTLAESSPSAIQSGLRCVQEVRGKDWKLAGEIAQRARREIFETADFQEGIRAFREKRKPQWPSISGSQPEKGG
jgi:enoyl-CoA hydratase/carnithine racemase